MTRLTVATVGWVALGLVAACGDEEQEEPTPAAEHCEEYDLKAFAAVSVDNGEAVDFEVESDDEVSGRIFDAHELRIELGQASPPGQSTEVPVIMRLYDATVDDNFQSYFDVDEPLTLDVYDATDLPPGDQDTTALSPFDCSFDDDTICAQVGFDSSEQGNLHDEDEFVYNAAGGTVTIEGFQTSPSEFSAHWDIELGRNVRVFDDESSGEFEGCIKPAYDGFAAGDYWTLE